MWFEKASGPPPQGSLLESLFTMVLVERKRAELLATRALVQASIPAGKDADPAIDAYQKYVDAMFPFLEKATDTDADDQKKNLAEFVKRNAKINLTEYFQRQVASSKNIAAMKTMRRKAQEKSQ